MALSSNEWAAQIAERVGRRVAHYRAQAPGEKTKPGITAQALADRCTSLGMPMDRTVVAKLEKGNRQTITVGEVIVLARALGVPPVALLFDLGDQQATEILPGESSDTWAALKWFTGEADRLPSDTEQAQDTEPVRLFREHDRSVEAWHDQRADLQRVLDSRGQVGRGDLDAQFAQLAAESLGRIADRLRNLREQMRSLELVPPELAPELSYVDGVGTSPQLRGGIPRGE
ncbi:helix-turn-helix domain-containing protein [Streptomyces mirabilis]